MWAHYGHKHTGFTLEFDGDYFRANGPHEVTYTSQRPTSSFSLYGDNNELSKDVVKLMTTKSDHWAYEKEQRFFFLPAQCTARTCSDGEVRNMYKIDAQSIRRIVIGIRTRRDDEIMLRELLQLTHFKHVSLRRAVIDDLNCLIREVDA